MASFEKAVKAQPDFAEAQFFTGRCHAKLGELSGAVEACRKAIASRPTFYPAYYQLALVELQQERTEEAI